MLASLPQFSLIPSGGPEYEVEGFVLRNFLFRASELCPKSRPDWIEDILVEDLLVGRLQAGVEDEVLVKPLAKWFFIVWPTKTENRGYF
jgi:hypothetical protein